MKLLSLNEIAALYDAVEAKEDELVDDLALIADLDDRKMKIECGLYSRIRPAREWLYMIQQAVKVDADAEVINMPDSVTVALFDAYIDIPR